MTAAPRNINGKIQPRKLTTDELLKVLRDVHGKTYVLRFSQTQNSYVVGYTVTCFTIQLLYSAEETADKVMLWLHYTQAQSNLKRVDTISFAVKERETSSNKLRFDFEGSSKNDLTLKEAEFVHRPPSCNSLKITFKNRGCVILALPTSSSKSDVNNCVPPDERGSCIYESYENSESEKCLNYESFEDKHQSEITDVTIPTAVNQPLLETDAQLQQYQDFKRGLLFGSLVLVYSSYEQDPFRLCMITYHPNKAPGPHGKLYILTSGLTADKAMVQTFNPYRLSYHSETYKTAARLYRDGKFYETRVIFTDKRQCIILRTPEYHNLCELFTGGRYTNGILNSICFFIYAVYCGQPEARFTRLGECWPPANK
uniref:Putative salivary lipocalin n=1 Tax=Ixodes ricinus TaxID=34613 RepID=A0A0K8R545_IXORI